MADLAIYRERFMVSARGSVEIRVAALPDDASVCAAFCCATCDELMAWNSDRRIFECPSCGYELTALEARSLCDWHVEQVEALSVLVGKKRGLLWRLLRWFGVGKSS